MNTEVTTNTQNANFTVAIALDTKTIGMLVAGLFIALVAALLISKKI